MWLLYFHDLNIHCKLAGKTIVFILYVETAKVALEHALGDFSNNIFASIYTYYVSNKEQLITEVEKNLNDWNIEKYKEKDDLTRAEYIDALNIFRGKYGSNYIYFFRYAPFKKLGNKINELSKYKDIYRININDEEVQKSITDIFYGFDLSNSNNKLLDKKYYENISKEEYFSEYDDTITMNFSRLNHISVSFKNGTCPLKFLEKINWD